MQANIFFGNPGVYYAGLWWLVDTWNQVRLSYKASKGAIHAAQGYARVSGKVESALLPSARELQT